MWNIVDSKNNDEDGYDVLPPPNSMYYINTLHSFFLCHDIYKQKIHENKKGFTINL